MYNLKLSAGYYPSLTKHAEIVNRNVSRQHAVRFKRVHKVTFEVVIGHITLILLKGVSVQFHRDVSRVTEFKRNIAF